MQTPHPSGVPATMLLDVACAARATSMVAVLSPEYSNSSGGVK
jgi:hypothetical protein